MTLVNKLEALNSTTTPGPWIESGALLREREASLVTTLRNHTPQIIAALRLLERAYLLVHGGTRKDSEWLADYRALVEEMGE